jgi:hypothetical protein
MVEYIFSQSIVISIPDYTEKNKLKYPDFEVGEGFDKMNTSKNTKNVKFIVKDLHPFEFVAQFLSIHNKNKNEKRIIFDLNSNLFKINKKKSEIKDIDGLEVVLNDVYGVTHTVSLKSGDTDTFKALNDELENKVFKLEDIDLDLNKFENSDKDIRAKHNKHSALRLQWVIDTDYLKDVEKDEEDKEEEVVETVDEVKRANEILGKLEHFTENEENEAINSAIKDVKEGVKEVEALIGEEDKKEEGSITDTTGGATGNVKVDESASNNATKNDEPENPEATTDDGATKAENASGGNDPGGNSANTEATNSATNSAKNAIAGIENTVAGIETATDPEAIDPVEPNAKSDEPVVGNATDPATDPTIDPEPEAKLEPEAEPETNAKPEDKLKDAKAKLSKLITTLLDILNKSKSRFIEEAKNLLKNEKTPNKKKIEDILPLLEKEDENTDELLNLISEIYTKENQVVEVLGVNEGEEDEGKDEGEEDEGKGEEDEGKGVNEVKEDEGKGEEEKEEEAKEGTEEEVVDGEEEKEAEDKADKEAVKSEDKVDKEDKEEEVAKVAEDKAEDKAEKEAKEEAKEEAKVAKEEAKEAKEAENKSEKEAEDKAKEAKEEAKKEAEDKADKEAKEDKEDKAKEAKEEAEDKAKEAEEAKKEAEDKADKEAKEDKEDKADKEAKEDKEDKADKEAKEKEDKEEAEDKAEKEEAEDKAEKEEAEDKAEKEEAEDKAKEAKEKEDKADKEAKEKEDKADKEAKEAKEKADKEEKAKAEEEKKAEDKAEEEKALKDIQGGGSSSSPQNLMNELNYEVHISLFIQKIMKMLIFRYLVHIKQELTYKEYLFEAFVNMVVFCVLNTGNDISFTCYILDQMITYIVLLLYLKFVDKEGLEINENYVSAIILVPYYLVLF